MPFVRFTFRHSLKLQESNPVFLQLPGRKDYRNHVQSTYPVIACGAGFGIYTCHLRLFRANAFALTFTGIKPRIKSVLCAECRIVRTRLLPKNGSAAHRRDSTQGQIFSMSMIRSVGPLETTTAFHSADFPDGPLNLSGAPISPSPERSSNSTPPTTVPILRLLRRRSQQVPWLDRLFLFRFRPRRSV